MRRNRGGTKKRNKGGTHFHAVPVPGDFLFRFARNASIYACLKAVHVFRHKEVKRNNFSAQAEQGRNKKAEHEKAA